MDFIFGYKLLKDANINIKEIFMLSKMKRFEKNLNREKMVKCFGDMLLRDFIGKGRFNYYEIFANELAALLKEEQYLKDDDFYSRFTINLQRKMRSGFLLEDIERLKGGVVQHIEPFYNRRNGIFGIKLVCEDRVSYFRFHGDMPNRNSVIVNKLENGIETPYQVTPSISSTVRHKINNPKKVRRKGEYDVEQPSFQKSLLIRKAKQTKEKVKKIRTPKK